MRVRARDQSGAFYTRALPGLIAAGVPQLKLIAATALVSASPAAVSWLYYANRLYELPLGVASIAIAAVIVPRIAASVHASDDATYAHAQSRAYEIALGVALPASTGFALLAPQIAAGLFEHGLFGAARHRRGRHRRAGDLLRPARPRAGESVRRGVVRA